jgi:hypothetical protein
MGIDQIARSGFDGKYETVFQRAAVVAREVVGPPWLLTGAKVPA